MKQKKKHKSCVQGMHVDMCMSSLKLKYKSVKLVWEKNKVFNSACRGGGHRPPPMICTCIEDFLGELKLDLCCLLVFHADLILLFVDFHTPWMTRGQHQ